MSLTTAVDYKQHPGKIFVAIALIVVTALPVVRDPDPLAGDAAFVSSAPTPADPPAPSQTIQPEDLARLLADTSTPRPVVLHVGPGVLFRGGHIAGSRHIDLPRRSTAWRP